MRVVPGDDRVVARSARVVRLRGAPTSVDEAHGIAEALDRRPVELPARLLYDARGSALFEAITRLDEYYPTRAETEILERHADAIVARARVDELFELGSGSSRKTRILIEAALVRGVSTYRALDVSEAALTDAADSLRLAYPGLEIEAIVGDFHADLRTVARRGRRLTLFLGSTIGNLHPPERARMLCGLRRAAAPGDALLVGYDLVKDPAELVAAYDDPGGLTAAFLRNGLMHFGRLAGARLPLADLAYRAAWVDPPGRMEMRFVARRELDLELPHFGRRLVLARGEHLVSEISTKFTRAGLADELAVAGWRPEATWADPAGRFEMVLARAGPVADA